LKTGDQQIGTQVEQFGQVYGDFLLFRCHDLRISAAIAMRLAADLDTLPKRRQPSVEQLYIGCDECVFTAQDVDNFSPWIV
jgi:hypothetical protein